LYYRCVITTACGTVNAGPYTVKVNDCTAAPTVTQGTASYTVNKSATAPSLSFTADLKGGAATYQWQSCATSGGTYANITTNGTSATYAAPTATAGTVYYKCIITTACGNVTTAYYTVFVNDCFSVSDAEGHTYTASKFGTAGCWMTQNLRSTWTMQGSTFRSIPKGINSGNVNSPYYDFPNASVDTIAHPEYGLLYTWAAANVGASATETSDPHVGIASTRQGICPSGWHLPSRYEWNMLAQEIGSNPALYAVPQTGLTGEPAQIAGAYMKSQTAVSGATNGYSLSRQTGGFDALLVATVISTGNPVEWGQRTRLWCTASSSLDDQAPTAMMVPASNEFSFTSMRKSYKGSVRCVRD
jgi:uncharacterized protein (TIGR02145 family)